MNRDLDGKVVIVTGAGRGLGRSHALEFARDGARVLVNDLGVAVDGTGSSNTAQSVVAEGGVAVANTGSVAIEQDTRGIIDTALQAFGTVNIVIKNAGTLRDKTFANGAMDNFRAVLDVHLMEDDQFNTFE